MERKSLTLNEEGTYAEGKQKRIYLFEEGNAQMKDLLGGKGANLAEMTARLGLPIPPGFTITTNVCNEYYKMGKELPPGLREEIEEKLKILEKKTGKVFGKKENPLLVSVRSGAAISMPGMMDTILNLGLNDQTVKGLAELTGDERFAYDCYRRFISMFGDVVLGMGKATFEEIFDKAKQKRGVKFDYELPVEDLKDIVDEFKLLIKQDKGMDLPQEPMEQLLMAVKAVFQSWNNPRAITFRENSKIPHTLGTAVNVQVMVFGNIGEDSGTGVAFSRNPSTGEYDVWGEFLMNAQGEDVVAGIRTPLPLSELQKINPSIHEQFIEIAKRLERHYQDVQDIEFTIEKGKLYILQTRCGRPTSSADAIVKYTVNMAEEGLISREEALLRIEPIHIDQLLHPRIDPQAKVVTIAKGIGASPGAATGEVVFDSNYAEKLAREEKRKVILVRPETNPDDVKGILASEGILTSRGGMTSHAALVARGWGKPCIVGCEAIKIDLEGRQFTVNGKIVKEGDKITINATTGEIILGEVPMLEPKELRGEFETVLSWADEFKELGVYANADTPEDAAKARNFGAQGIGLCRTEHMFMGEQRQPIMKEMIMAITKEERERALSKLLPMQKGDFKEILKIMEGLPVTIRLLDPPLHEFLPRLEDLIKDVTRLRITGESPQELQEKERILRKVEALHEANPMLGLRVCRLGILYPEIYEMQVRAIIEATCELITQGIKAMPEIMIPGVGHVEEIRYNFEIVHRIARIVMEEMGVNVEYKVGTMIELPRACVVADQLAKHAQFFSFGTNDLTQTTFGYSRDDAEATFIPVYLEKGILNENPFQSIDREGVGELMIMGVNKGRSANPQLKIGICGEHGGDPSSIEFCHLVGLNYVSCSPFRVPVARLAAASAAIRHKRRPGE